MAQYIQVGKDIIEFPDNMSEADISAALASPPSSAPSSAVMGMKEPISGGAELLPRGLSALTSLGGAYPNVASKFFQSEAERVAAMNKAEEQAYQAQRAAQGGTGFDVGRMVGNVISPANLAVGARAAQGAKALGIGGQAAIAGASQAALQPVTNQDEFWYEKAQQAGLGALAGKAGELAAKGVGRVMSPLVSKAEATMRSLGITPTPGQTLGGAFKKAEDFAQNLPLIGEQIRSGREKVLFDFNKGVINKALSKIDDQLPANVIGRDAVSYAAEQVSNKYDDVLKNIKFDLDTKTTSGILDALDKAPLPSSAMKAKAIDILNNVALSKFSGKQLTGQEYKSIEASLRKTASDYSNSSVPDDRAVGEALKDALKVFKTELYYQNPKQTPQLRRVDSAYGDLSVMERAAANTGAENGVFTPKQYNAAVKQSDVSRNKRQFARGQAREQSVSEAALKTLGEDSKATLEGRLAMGSLGGMAALSQPMIAGPAALASMGIYSAPGLKITDALLRQRPELARMFGKQLQQQAPMLGGLFGAPISQEVLR